jgi:hypothetical protein
VQFAGRATPQLTKPGTCKWRTTSFVLLPGGEKVTLTLA